MSSVVQQWAAERGYLSRVFPSTSDSWDPVASPVARYLLHLKVLGIEDPTKHLGKTATEHYRRALALRDHAIRVAAEHDGEAAIANRLATGEIDVEQAEKLLVKVPAPSDSREQEDRARRMRETATHTAYANAVRAVHLLLDQWLNLLRPLVEQAVAAQDQQRFDALHRFAALLRDRYIGALAMVASDTTGIREMEETWRYTVARPDLYHRWRLEHAVAAHAISTEKVGPFTFVAAVVTEGPSPALVDMIDGGMEPGLYAASEVMAITARVLGEQETAHMSAEPQTQTRGAKRVVMTS